MKIFNMRPVLESGSFAFGLWCVPWWDIWRLNCGRKIFWANIFIFYMF